MIDVKKLSEEIDTPWGEIGYIVLKRTYSRRLKNDDPNSPTEEFWQIVERELKAIRKQLKINFSPEEEETYARYRLSLKFSVAGRFMWQLGTKTVDKLGLTSLQNCSFCVVNEPVNPFVWAFEMLMLGSGVGFNIQRENVYQIPKLKGKIKIERKDTNDADFIVPDSREGWVKLLSKVLKAHFYSGKGFTYSTICIRSKGAPIKGFGGIASGPEELCNGIEEIHKILNSRAKKKLRPIDCLDIMNIIGNIVVSGNVRRSAQIAIGDYDDIEFLKAKRWDLGNIPNWRAMSNNSVYAPEDISMLPKEYWDTYIHGEPYGLINIELARSCGRVGDTRYPDPEVEGFNPCQPEFATVLTKEGVKQFKDLKINDEIWSKEGWTKVINKWSNGIKPVYAYYTTGGVFIGTENHKVDTRNGKLKVSEADNILTIAGNKCNKVDFDPQIVMDGLFLGDGYHKLMKGRDYTYPFLVIGKNDYDYFSSEVSPFIKDSYKKGRDYIVKTTITKEEKLKPWEITIPDRYFLKDSKTTLSLLRGLFSANGSVIKLKGNGCRITYKSTSKKLIRQIQLMLSSVGIRSYYTTNLSKKVKFYNGEYICKESYDLNITKDVKIFQELIGFIQRYKNEKIINWTKNYSPNTKQTYHSIVEVEYIGDFEVFDITVDNPSHTYWTGGLSVSNCAEQSLANYETCCLSEVFLPNIESYEELLDVLKYTYIVNKHSLALPCHLEDTEKIVHKNMRMGIGMTGVLQATEEQRSWLKDAYEWLRKFDEEYSRKMGFPVSIKLTTIKPSGTLSLLAGVTPGIHPSPAGPYYYRRVRMAKNDPLVELCRKNGYRIEPVIEFDGSHNKNTVVVTFPCKLPDGVPIASNFSFKEQLDMVRRMQKEWSDNSVSCTVYYRKEDIPAIKEYLEKHFRNEIKSVSFLLQQDHGFIQAPYETITEEQYMEEVSKIKRITDSRDLIAYDSNDMFDSECANSCPVK